MRRISIAALAIFLSVETFAATPPFETIPIDDIRPGMVGEGRTVFSGDTIESFKVRLRF